MLLAALAVAAALFTSQAQTTLSFLQTPAEVTSKLAANCMERGHTVIDLTPTQVRCEIRLTNEMKGHILFTRFQQANYTGQVRMFIAFTVVPSATGSLVQHRQWYEAVINGANQSAAVVDPGLIDAANEALKALGGVWQ